jgi:hypothetical protein
LEEKNRVIFNYEKELLARKKGCIDCASREATIQKLKELIISQNKLTMQSIDELE